MKKAILAISLIGAMLQPVGIVLAVAGINEIPISSEVDIANVLDKAANWILGLLVAAGGIMGIGAGFIYLQAGGDAAKVKKASTLLIYTAVAIGLGVLSKTIVTIVRTFMGI